MSYPFGSGMPPNNNAGPYPQSAPYPQSVPFGAGFIPQNSGYPPQNPGYPSQNPGYPPQNPGYPPQNPGYPPQNPGYPPQNPGYPTQQSHPSQPQYPINPAPYPTNSPGYPVQSSTGFSYPSQQSNFTAPYPPASHHQSHYPSSTPSMYPPMPGNSSFGYQAPGSGYQGGFNAPQMTNYNAPQKSKGNPTVVPEPNFNPVDDAKALRKAMKGWGTDEDALINIICRRSNSQRQLIEKEYKTNFGKDLIEDLKSETSGNFEKLLIALMTPIVDYYCVELYEAMAGLGTDEDVLIEILCSMTNYEINTIKSAYESKYGKNLESELISETSGNFKRLLVSLCAAGRDESGITDPARAAQDATELLRAGELRVGTDESTFNMVLCQRNYAQIRLVCEEYQKITGHSLEVAIENEFSGDILEGLQAIIQCVTNKSEFFARRLHKSMAGLGTTDSQLIRIVVTRSEIDMNDIKEAFQNLYGESLRSWIKGDTSGHYKHALYALIGEERSS